MVGMIDSAVATMQVLGVVAMMCGFVLSMMRKEHVPHENVQSMARY
ncbi:MAG TPA: hypothetical protein VJU83_11745 [Burkholderiales bacterium]|nr:hypothetical protein [Burkholderiales bacterium]